ncbi:MAG: hypothetical protein UU34_C0017G0008 [Candidatus Curtissbacteria bacterium GW2011_GWA1_41_11]|uniref:EamA domain-containing protein n=1 Tax=Candidatus Curtissbacteria bacterium GW2011_GWA1_41_11 TaxID=1618409 RepID=A0A0G0XEZ2_9BACT|nr:MAG: hypothetical protein UU34_C0017G0008 [Candidatus Curtissbacteria bacterium GW2011_GWA1_41_11]
MQAILFALVSYFTWGTGILVEAIVARKINSFSLALWALILSVVVSSFYVPFVVNDLKNLTFGLLIFIIAIGLVGLFFGTIVYYEALKKGNRALVGTIASSFPAVAVLISVIFLNERISTNQTIAIVIIFIGIILSSLELKELRNKNLLKDKSILMALITMFSWGMWIALLKIPVAQIGWFWPNYITFLLFPLIFFYIKLKKIPIERPTINGAFIPLVASTALVRIAEYSYNFGISKGLVTVVAPIAGANPTLFVILAFLFLKDPITKQQMLGIITTLAGIVLLSFFST